MFDFSVVLKFRHLLLEGIGVTTQLTILGLGGGIVLGLFVSLLRMSKWQLLRLPAYQFIEIFRNIPELVQLLWIYIVLPYFFEINLKPYFAALIFLWLNGSAYAAEIFRAGILAVDKGQQEAARALGMSNWVKLRVVILPQATRYMLPMFVNESVRLLKTTSLVSVIAVPDVLYQASNLAATTFLPLEFYTVVGIIYFFLITPVAVVMVWIQKRLESKN